MAAINWHWETFDAVDSTNRIAGERVLQRWERSGGGESADGLVIAAKRQTAGRGQHGRRWESPAGGLYLSAVIEDFPVDCRDRLALVAGVALAEALQEPGTYADADRARREGWRVGVQVRWPNDVLIGDRKVAGILCESVAQGARWAGIVGVGVNVSGEMGQIPPDLRPFVASLEDHDGRPRSIRGMAEELLRRLDELRGGVRQHGFLRVVEPLRRFDALRDRRLTVDTGEAVLEGIATGISDRGELIVRPLSPGGKSAAAEVAILQGTLLAVDGRPVRPMDARPCPAKPIG